MDSSKPRPLTEDEIVERGERRRQQWNRLRLIGAALFLALLLGFLLLFH
jgi:hypothetical protein